MNFRADSSFRPGSISAIEEMIAARILAAVQEGAKAVLSEAQALVPVDTGELRDSGQTVVTLEGKTVTGAVEFTSAHAAYVEFGTGIRGAGSPGAGPVDYSPSWPGMPAQPYLRPAIDTAAPAIKEAFREQGFDV